MTTMNATYSPEDNKLRLYASARLDEATYARVSDAGFKYAPKQKLFVAPSWTPAREDLLIELCGEVGDEDTTLAERAEIRAERFTDHSESRKAEADATRAAVRAISDRIPFGQPILVGHHSEGRHRRDAQKIHDGIGRAVRLWDQSEYWTRRAAASLAHADHKSDPSVRARRIKELEADLRSRQRSNEEAETALKLWSAPDLTHEKAIVIAARFGIRLARKEGDREDHDQQPSAHDVLTNQYPALYAPRELAEVVDAAKRVYTRSIEWYARWISHYQNRIAFERAMLGEQGANAAEGVDVQPGGRVLIGKHWYTVKRVTKKDGRAVSVSLDSTTRRIRLIEEVLQYEPPAADVAAAVKAANKLPPICNYPGESFIHITKAEWDALPKDYRGMKHIPAQDGKGAHRVRRAIGAFLKLTGDMNARHNYYSLFVTDDKRKDPPAGDAE